MKRFIKGKILSITALSLFTCLFLFQSNAQDGEGVDTISYPVDGSLTLIRLGKHTMAVCSGDKKDCTIRSKH